MKKLLSSKIACRNSIKIIFLVVIIIISTFALILYLQNKELSKAVLVSQNQEKQLVIARAGSRPIEYFFKSLQYELTLLEKSGSVSSVDKEKTTEEFLIFINRFNETPVTDIVRLDSNGIEIIGVNNVGSKTGTGENFSDRDYFKWAKNPVNRGKVYITKPFISRTGSNKGKLIVGLVVPLYNKNNFNGLALVEVSSEKFGETYISNLIINKGSFAFLVYDDQYRIVDKVVNDKNKFCDSEKDQKSCWNKFISENKDTLSKNQEGKMIFRSEKDYILAFSKVSLADNNLILIVGASDINADSSFLGLSRNQNLWLMIIVIITLIAGAILVLVDNISYRDGFIKGCRKGIESVGKKKD